MRKKKKIPASRLAVFLPTRPTGNNFLLKGGLMLNPRKMLDIIQSPFNCAVEVISCLRTNLFKHVLLLDPALMLACLQKPHI